LDADRNSSFDFADWGGRPLPRYQGDKEIVWKDGTVVRARTWQTLLDKVRADQRHEYDEDGFRGVMAERALKWSGVEIDMGAPPAEFFAELERADLLAITGRHDTFEVSCSIRGVPYTISWADGVFDDPSGATTDLIARGETVGLTPTGPFYKAGASPVETAIVTAMAAIDDRRIRLNGEAEAIIAAIHDGISLPDGAVP